MGRSAVRPGGPPQLCTPRHRGGRALSPCPRFLAHGVLASSGSVTSRSRRGLVDANIVHACLERQCGFKAEFGARRSRKDFTAEVAED